MANRLVRGLLTRRRALSCLLRSPSPANILPAVSIASSLSKQFSSSTDGAGKISGDPVAASSSLTHIVKYWKLQRAIVPLKELMDELSFEVDECERRLRLIESLFDDISTADADLEDLDLIETIYNLKMVLENSEVRLCEHCLGESELDECFRTAPEGLEKVCSSLQKHLEAVREFNEWILKIIVFAKRIAEDLGWVCYF